MESITVYAAAPHGLEFTTLAAFGISLLVVGMIVWRFVGWMRSFRQDDQLPHSGH